MYSEARRHNALMRSTSLDEPLKPLLRPVGSPSASPNTGTATTAENLPSNTTKGSTQAGAKGGDDHGPKNTNSATDKKKANENKSSAQNQNQKPVQNPLPRVNTSGGTSAGKRDSVEGGGKPVLPNIITDLAAPTPSPLFPKDLISLMRLSPHETLTLMEDYGLVPVRQAGTSPMPREGDKGVVSPNPDAEPSREENINRFLNHIGVCT